MKRIFLTALAVLALTGCHEEQNTADSIQRHQQEQIAIQATQSVGMPAIVNFAEKRALKEIFELRDAAVVTITYVRDMNGKLHKVCDSIGFGIPYSTQYTNPMRAVLRSDVGGGNFTMPQADPNGLFSPSSSEGTWVLCLNPENKKASATYVEDRITVSQFKLAD